MSTIDQIPQTWKVKVAPQVREALTPQGIQAVMCWVGPWEERHDFLEVVRGYEEPIEYPGNVTVLRRVPLKYPDERYDDVYAVACEFEGMGTPGASEYGITYSKCMATVTFQSEPFLWTSTDYPLVSISRGGSADMITVPGTAYEFPSDSLRLDQNAGVLVPTVDFSMTFHKVVNLAPIVAAWDARVGRVNTDTFVTPDGAQYAAGYVQFLTYTTQTIVTGAGQVEHSATAQLRYRDVPHNEIMRPDGTGFEAPERVGSSDKLLKTAALMGMYV